MKQRTLDTIFDRVFGGNFQPTSSVICSGDGDGDGDGGDGGDGGGGGGGGGGDGDDERMSKGEIKTYIGNMVHGAVRKQLGSTSFKDTIGGIIGDSITSAMESAKTNQTVDPPDGDGKSWKDSEEFKAMKKRDEARDAEIEEMKNERKEEAKTKKRRGEKDALSKALTDGGVPAERLRGALSMLINDDKVLKRDDDDNIVYVTHEEWGEELVTVEKGVAKFLKTPEGMSLLPPTNARGTGNRGGSRKGGKQEANRPGNEKMAQDEAEATVSDWILSQ